MAVAADSCRNAVWIEGAMDRSHGVTVDAVARWLRFEGACSN
jgi:hypothetical protein